jgi:hypothetical protein
MIGARLTKISLSSIYKNYENDNNSIKIPLVLQPGRWTVVCLNIDQILQENGFLKGEGNDEKPFYLRSMQICSTINIWNVFTSDYLYNISTMPQ